SCGLINWSNSGACAQPHRHVGRPGPIIGTTGWRLSCRIFRMAWSPWCSSSFGHYPLVTYSFGRSRILTEITAHTRIHSFSLQFCLYGPEEPHISVLHHRI